MTSSIQCIVTSPLPLKNPSRYLFEAFNRSLVSFTLVFEKENISIIQVSFLNLRDSKLK